MPKYIVSFIVTIDGPKHQETGTIGVSSPTTDYHPNRVKSTVEEQYRQKFPGKPVAVVIQKARQATNQEYLKASAGFIEIKKGKGSDTK